MPVTLQPTSIKYKSNGVWQSADTIKGDDYVLTEQDKEDIAELVESPVQDVQVNGTSVVSQGVANVPVAGSSTLGVVKTTTSYGTFMQDGFVGVSKASSQDVKGGTHQCKAIVPYNQHESAFYALAKAAGDTTQSASSNSVGTYTDTAKEKIQSMLDTPSQDAIADKETAMATAAHAIGDLFLMGGKLYKATAAISIGDTIVTSGTGANAEQTNVAEEIPSIPVTDVQVNGTSILSQGVANVPMANGSNPGVVIVRNESDGLKIDSSNRLSIAPATTNQIKGATTNYKVITPFVQGTAAFYGLASVAGDTTQKDSSNAVGTYTEDAKKAICTMLGVKYEAPFRLIYEQTITEETGKIVILSDMANNPFSLSEILVLFDEMTGTGTSNSGVLINSESIGSNVAYLSVSNLYNSTAQRRTAHIWIAGGRMFGESDSANLSSDYAPIYMQHNKNASGWIACNDINKIAISSLNAHKFTAGTITIYGR